MTYLISISESINGILRYEFIVSVKIHSGRYNYSAAWWSTIDVALLPGALLLISLKVNEGIWIPHLLRAIIVGQRNHPFAQEGVKDSKYENHWILNRWI